MESMTTQLFQICVNDGDGSQCGYSYARRVELCGIGMDYHYLQMVRQARRWLHSQGVYYSELEKTANGQKAIELEATRQLKEYYQNHLTEISASSNIVE